MNRKDEILIIYHNDLDGLCSAVILIFCLEKIEFKPKKIISLSMDSVKKFLNEEKFDYDKVFILDLSISQFKEIKRLKENVILIDHHPSERKLKNLIHVNPRFVKSDIYMPVSYVMYKICGKIVDMREKEWVAVLGILADYAYEDCKDVVDRWIKIRTREELWNTRFGRVVVILDGALRELGTNNIMKKLLKADSLNEIENCDEILKAYEKFKVEYKRCKEEFWENLDEVKELNLVFSSIKSKYEKLGSSLSTEISRKNPEQIVILFDEKDGYTKVHGRCQSGTINIGKVLEYATRDIGQGGGHEKAGGGIIQKNKKSLFKKRVVSAVLSI